MNADPSDHSSSAPGQPQGGDSERSWFTSLSPSRQFWVKILSTYGLAVFLVLFWVFKLERDFVKLEESVRGMNTLIEHEYCLLRKDHLDSLIDLFVDAAAPRLAEEISNQLSSEIEPLLVTSQPQDAGAEDHKRYIVTTLHTSLRKQANCFKGLLTADKERLTSRLQRRLDRELAEGLLQEVVTVLRSSGDDSLSDRQTRLTKCFRNLLGNKLTVPSDHG